MVQPEPNSNWIYLCDDIVVEPHAHRLARDGHDVPVEPKTYAVLVVLLDHAGEVVGKDALLDAAWGHRHVTPGVLNRVISQLRHALGDSVEHPHYIATVHSLGYRFIGTVQRCPVCHGPLDIPPMEPEPASAPTPANIDTTIPAATTTPDPMRHRSRRTAWLSVSVIGLALVVLVAFMTVQRGRAPRAEPAQPGTVATSPTPMLAVLPIALPAAAQDLQPAMDGLTESLIDQLSFQPGLHVVPLTRVLALPRPVADARKTAAALGADLLLTGELKPSGTGPPQLQVRLLSTSANDTRWQRQYPMTLDTLSATSLAIRTDLLEQLHPIVPTNRTDAPLATSEAEDNYQLGLEVFWYKLSNAAILASIRHYEKAIAADPGHARAWCQLGAAYMDLTDTGYLAKEVGMAHAEPAIRHGLQLAPAAAECHASLAELYLWQGDFASSLPEYRRAIVLDPDQFGPRFMLANAQVALGRPREALTELDRVMAEHPQMVDLEANKIRAAVILGEPAVARTAFTRLSLTGPAPATWRWFGMFMEAECGQPARAIHIGLGMVQTDPKDRATRADLALVYLRVGATRQASTILKGLGDGPYAGYWFARSWQFLAEDDPAGAVRFLRTARPPPSLAALSHALLAQALALNGEDAAAIAAYRQVFASGFAKGDPFVDFINLELGLGQLANWAALLPTDDPQRQAIVLALRQQYARLHDGGVAMPSFVYHEAVLTALQGDAPAAVRGLREAIDQGFRDGPALRRDLAWRALAHDPAFQRQRQRLESLLAIERQKLEPVPAL